MLSRSYKEKLQDPRWRAKRERIIEVRGHKCQMCYRTDRQLTIHHGYYKFSTEPWDYEDWSLWCLCWPCHQKAQTDLVMLHRAIGHTNPGDIPSLWPKIDEATFEAQYGLSREEADALVKEEQQAESVLYAEYQVYITACSEFGPTVAPLWEAEAIRQFPGLEVIVTERENDVDGNTTVEGPDPDICQRLQHWFEKKRG